MFGRIQVNFRPEGTLQGLELSATACSFRPRISGWTFMCVSRTKSTSPVHCNEMKQGSRAKGLRGMLRGRSHGSHFGEPQVRKGGA